MKPLSERLEALRKRSQQYKDTCQVSDALVPMVRHAEDMEARIKELEDALRMFLDGVGASDLGDACDNARAILNKR